MNALRRHSLALLPGAWMTLIWELSADSSSGVRSLRLARWIWSNLLTPLCGFVPSYPILFTTDAIARKAAHVTEYGIMAALFLLWVRHAWPAWAPARIARMTWLLTIAWAAIDELHQSFVPGRGAHVSDVLIDAVGASIVMLVWLRWQQRPREANG